MTQLHSAEAIGAEIKTRLLTRTVAAGAETNLGVTVHRGRRAIDDDQMPCTSLIEAEEQPVQAPGRTIASAKVERRFSVHAYLPCDPNDPNIAAHAGIRDIKRALFSTGGKPDTTLGGTVVSVEYRGSDIGTRPDGAGFVKAIVDVGVTYVENLADPS